jgi:hypothetical protein
MIAVTHEWQNSPFHFFIFIGLRETLLRALSAIPSVIFPSNFNTFRFTDFPTGAYSLKYDKH